MSVWFVFCHAQTQCLNTQGSYECRCLPGYAGDGIFACAGRRRTKRVNNDLTIYNTLRLNSVSVSSDIQNKVSRNLHCSRYKRGVNSLVKGWWNGAWHLMLYPFKIWLKLDIWFAIIFVLQTWSSVNQDLIPVMHKLIVWTYKAPTNVDVYPDIWGMVVPHVQVILK